jgi:hypothetical protein
LRLVDRLRKDGVRTKCDNSEVDYLGRGSSIGAIEVRTRCGGLSTEKAGMSTATHAIRPLTMELVSEPLHNRPKFSDVFQLEADVTGGSRNSRNLAGTGAPGQ